MAGGNAHAGIVSTVIGFVAVLIELGIGSVRNAFFVMIHGLDGAAFVIVDCRAFFVRVLAAEGRFVFQLTAGVIIHASLDALAVFARYACDVFLTVLAKFFNLVGIEIGR